MVRCMVINTIISLHQMTNKKQKHKITFKLLQSSILFKFLIGRNVQFFK